MNNQACDGITDAGKDLVLSCIKSQELRDHMRKYLYWPAPIIAGSMKTLDEKRTMLEQLRMEVSPELFGDIDSHLTQLNSALEMLNNVERDRGILLLHVMFYNEEERDADALDGPFPIASWDAAQTLMKRYIEEYPDDDWSESYWKINLYTSEDLHEHQTAQPSLSFAATRDGELIFFSDLRNHRTRKSHVECAWRNDSRRFCANNEPVYTPWVPGDILKIDGRPFDHGPRFAIVLENDYEHTLRGQIWCAGPSKDHGVKEGSLSSGTFSDSLLDPFIPSALYTAERYTGDLPDDCAFMLELSQKLHGNPDYGKQWFEGSVGHDCLQPYRKPASQSELDIRTDILEFLDSRSIKEHLQRIDYELTTPVAAFIVDRSHKATLQQKLEGWQKIIDNMPNCTMSRRNDTVNIPDFHAFLRNVIRQEQRKLAHFKRTDGQSLYFFEDYSWDRRDRCDLLCGPYSSYQKCLDAIWREFEGDNPKATKITRRPIDPTEDHYVDDMVVLNANGEVMSCDYRFEGEWDEAGTASDFEDMWFDIPTPFHAGDIVCNLQRPDEPMVLFDLQTWGSARVNKELVSSVYKDRLVEKADKLLRWHRYDGDTSDMYAYGCQVSSALHFPFYIGEPEGFLLDIDYYREPLKSAERILYGVRAYIKGDLTVDSLAAMASACELQTLAEKKARGFEDADSWLKDRYPELFDETVDPFLEEGCTSCAGYRHVSGTIPPNCATMRIPK